MNKLNKKLIGRILFVFCVVVTFSFVMNSFFLPKYLLYQKKHALAAVTDQLVKMDTEQLLKNAVALENEHDVTIVNTPFHKDMNELNSTIIDRLNKKGITLSKFWITEESINKLNENQMVRKIYNQEKLKSSFLVTFMKKDQMIVVVGESISHSTETLKIVNQFNLYIYAGELLLLILLSAFFTRSIVRPLAKIQEAAEGISHLSFTKVQIRTNDEIESLANSINIMSDKLEHAHQELEAKNENLRQFIANISHELKTPLSLIKAYSSGIKDGMDDGTYINVIQQQTDDISSLVTKLLELSKLQTDIYRMSTFDFRQLLHRSLQKYRLSIQQEEISLSVDDRLLTHSLVFADEQKIAMALNNFISNAVKYSANQQIRIAAQNREEHIYFSITNGVENGEQRQWESIWEPFHVMESSRNKQLSGTGLGLSIARTILQKHEAPYGFHVDNEEITFYFSLPVNTTAN